jgi:hypothetical protein
VTSNPTNARPAATREGDHLTNSIRTVKQLREHLIVAMQLELATIPPYLTALYSIKDGTNIEAAELIRSVVMEEMLHLTLAANLLNAVGGRPRLTDPAFVPAYGRKGITLPHSGMHFHIGIERFERASVETFMRIEQPSKSDRPQGDHYTSIGRFYAAISEGLEFTVAQFGAAKVFTGNASHQVTGSLFYGGGGEALAVTDLASASQAILEIVSEGEGAETHEIESDAEKSIWDGDDRYLGEPAELSHYCRFLELHTGRRFVRGDTLESGPTGPLLPIDWKAVWPMKANPQRADWPKGSPIRTRLDAFATLYSDLLRQLQAAFTGSPALLAEAVPTMYRLKYAAQELMRTPSGDGKTTVGPAWDYVS